MHIPHGAPRSGAPRVTLLTEGTYPHSHGGVSVWCDQLVTGMPDIAFDVLAVTGTGREPVVWDVPAHVGTIVSVPMWGPAPEGQAPYGRPGRRLAESYEQFVTALLDPRAEGGFGPALYALARAGEDGGLSPFLRGDQALGILTAVWNRPGLAVREARPTLHDAVTATALLEHALRPLAAPCPKAGWRTRSAEAWRSCRASPRWNGTVCRCCSPSTACICASATSDTAPPPTGGR